MLTLQGYYNPGWSAWYMIGFLEGPMTQGGIHASSKALCGHSRFSISSSRGTGDNNRSKRTKWRLTFMARIFSLNISWTGKKEPVVWPLQTFILNMCHKNIKKTFTLQMCQCDCLIQNDNTIYIHGKKVSLPTETVIKLHFVNCDSYLFQSHRLVTAAKPRTDSDIENGTAAASE